jgi:hypothetical protein
MSSKMFRFKPNLAKKKETLAASLQATKADSGALCSGRRKIDLCSLAYLDLNALRGRDMLDGILVAY